MELWIHSFQSSGYEWDEDVQSCQGLGLDGHWHLEADDGVNSRGLWGKQRRQKTGKVRALLSFWTIPDHGVPMLRLRQWLVPLPHFPWCSSISVTRHVRLHKSAPVNVHHFSFYHSLLSSLPNLTHQYPRVKDLGTDLQTSHRNQMSFPVFSFWRDQCHRWCEVFISYPRKSQSPL